MSLCTLLGKQNRTLRHHRQVDIAKNMTRLNRSHRLGGWGLAQIILHFYSTLASPASPLRTVANILFITRNTTREFCVFSTLSIVIPTTSDGQLYAAPLQF